eukprot:522174-Rhodomonas_salina.1
MVWSFAQDTLAPARGSEHWLCLVELSVPMLLVWFCVELRPERFRCRGAGLHSDRRAGDGHRSDRNVHAGVPAAAHARGLT